MKKNSSLEIFESLNFYLVRLKVRPNPYSDHQPPFKSPTPIQITKEDENLNFYVSQGTEHSVHSEQLRRPIEIFLSVRMFKSLVTFVNLNLLNKVKHTSLRSSRCLFESPTRPNVTPIHKYEKKFEPRNFRKFKFQIGRASCRERV